MLRVASNMLAAHLTALLQRLAPGEEHEGWIAARLKSLDGLLQSGLYLLQASRGVGVGQPVCMHWQAAPCAAHALHTPGQHLPDRRQVCLCTQLIPCPPPPCLPACSWTSRGGTSTKPTSWRWRWGLAPA